MRTVSLFLLAIAAAVGAPLVAADEAPPSAATLCEVAQNPLTVDFEFHALCSATADCGAFPDKSCSAGGTCVGVDRNCSSGSFGERGYVSCGGSTQYCAGQCCGQDNVCEYSYGCGCLDKDCCDLSVCKGTRNCPEPPCSCSAVTDCKTDDDCCTEGSICTSSGICLCVAD